jgi:hypothetical protein
MQESAANGRRAGPLSVYDLEHGYDHNGREIYIVEYQDPTNKPKIWYAFASNGKLVHYERDMWGTTGRTVGMTEWI